MTNKEITDLYNALISMKDKKLPVKMSFILTRNIKKIEDIVKEVEESRMKILKEYGDKDEDGELIINESGLIKIEPNLLDKCNEDLNDLLAYEPDVILEGIPIEEVEKCDFEKYDSLTFDEIYSIERIINEEVLIDD